MWMIENEEHAKARWRAFCAHFLGWMQAALRRETPRAPRAPGLAVVLVEFRPACTDAVTFVLLQALRQLGRAPVHVVCGRENRDQLAAALRPFRPWAASIRLHAGGAGAAAGVRHYNRLLLTPAFWELFPEDRLLVMQEDSCLFDGDLAPFLKYDYVGAPWVHKDENAHAVGNGGFSLRSRHAMLRVLRWLDGDFRRLRYSHHTRRHWTDPNHPPEDVVFANALWRHPRLGALAPRAVAAQFAQEAAAAPPGVRGGHQWWLHALRDLSRPYPLLAVLCRLFPVAVVASPYAFTVGGGEKYLSHMLHALTRDQALFPLVCTPTAPATVAATLEHFVPGAPAWRALARACPWDALRAYAARCARDQGPAAPAWRPHTLVHMHNAAAPAVPAVARARNWLHCQFPFDLGKPPPGDDAAAALEGYDCMVVNSDFTLRHARRRCAELGAASPPRLVRVYPPCVDRGALPRAPPPPSAGSKVPRSCVMVGRLAAPCPMGNNKCHHVAVRAFNALHEMGETAPSLTIVGACTDPEWEAELRRRIRSPRITLVVNASEKQKNACLRRAQTLLHLTGMEDTRPQNEEHFGIVLIEAMAAGCAPLCYRGGFPGEWLPDTHLVDSEEALVRRLRQPAPPPPLQRDLTPFTHQAFAAAVRRLSAG